MHRPDSYLTGTTRHHDSRPNPSMHWIAASEQRLRDASDQFRANSGPIFSPIFLRCAPRRIRLAGPDYPNGTPTMLPRQPLRFLIIMAGLLT